MMNKKLFCVCLLTVLLLANTLLSADDLLKSKVHQNSNRISNIENDLSTIEDRAEAGVVVFLFGSFCALWAQNSRRNPWLWFILGVIFSVVAVVILLIKNADDNKTNPHGLK